MKIAWINLVPYETKEYMGIDFSPLWDGFKRYFKKLCEVRPEVEVTLCFPEKSTYNVAHCYIEFLNNRWFLEKAIQAEKEGYDAVVLGAATDTGLQILRSVLEIPVVGVSESAFLLACMLGSKFAGITVFDILIGPKERNIKLYGLESRAISRNPVRSCELTPEEIAGLFDENILRQKVIPKFEKVAKECIADGAEVIVADDAWLSPAFAYYGYSKISGTEVSVVDAAGAAVKMAELLVDLKKAVRLTVSRHISYRKPSPEALQLARKICELGE
jgi:allantoin racemase